MSGSMDEWEIGISIADWCNIKYDISLKLDANLLPAKGLPRPKRQVMEA